MMNSSLGLKKYSIAENNRKDFRTHEAVCTSTREN